ncbi:MAG: PEP/pyruvate-binding domain-containing protein [Simkaniaceae bacterium]|nr:PEP/pyruvate-binding domain-containing protein [Candidatus Sacchlamyda saccharinae]
MTNRTDVISYSTDFTPLKAVSPPAVSPAPVPAHERADIASKVLERQPSDNQPLISISRIEEGFRSPLGGLSSEALHGFSYALRKLEDLCEQSHPAAAAEIDNIGWELEALVQDIEDRDLAGGVAKQCQQDPSEFNQQKVQTLLSRIKKLQSYAKEFGPRWEALLQQRLNRFNSTWAEHEKEEHTRHFPKLEQLLQKACDQLAPVATQEKCYPEDPGLFAGISTPDHSPQPEGPFVKACRWFFPLMQLSAMHLPQIIQVPQQKKAATPLRREVQLFSKALQDGVGSPTSSPTPLVDLNLCYSLPLLESSTQVLVADQRKAIDAQVAVGSKEYGNKHVNNLRQSQLVEALGLDGFQVPGSMGVKSSEVLALLQQTAPAVLEAWETLGRQYSGQADFMQQESTKEALEEIQQGIEEAFSYIPLPPEMTTWLEQLSERGSYLMVRSTGAEDSRKAANAGGNLSVPYVAPNEQELKSALAKVVCSYFGAGSLQNRLNAGLNPFEEDLSLAVSTQELVGEPIGGSTNLQEIPISLVAFSNEPLFIGDEKFRVMRLSATYGHGEGVVGNQDIESDTILVLHSKTRPDQLYILYDNHEKPDRLAPVSDGGKITLQRVANLPQMINAPALSRQQIAKLFEWGVIAESFFEDDATDMEIVTKGKMIYPVQARPVNRVGLLPTYMQPDAEPIIETQRQKVLVAGKASVVEIENLEQVLRAESLEEAERKFDKTAHRLVVVYKDEPSNSHPVVNFSSMGVPCLYAKNREAAEALLAKSEPIAVCMQAGEMHLWDPEKGKIADHTKQGFVVHPANLAISQPITASLAADARVDTSAPEEVQELLRRVQAAKAQDKARASLKQLRLHAWVNRFLSVEGLQRPVAQVAGAMRSSVTTAFAELGMLYSGTEMPGRLESLLRVKVLDTLLFKQSEPGTGLGQHSVASMQANFAAAETLAAYQRQLSHTAHFADILMVGTESPHPEVFEKWQSFLLELESLVEEQKITSNQVVRLKHIIQSLKEANILPVYLTLFFDREEKVPLTRFEKILESLPQKDLEKISSILEEAKEVQVLQAQLVDFAQPHLFQKRLELLLAQKERLLEGESFAPLLARKSWETTSPLVKFTALEAWKDFLQTYDFAIKEMLKSSQHSEVEKQRLFKQMLLPYFQYMREITDRLIPPHTFNRMELQLLAISNVLSTRPDNDSSQLRPSDGFSVAAAMFGSKASFEKHMPKTRADSWTTIHQNGLAVIGWLSNEMLSQSTLEDSVPKSLVDAAGKFEVGIEEERGIGAIKRIGLEVDADKIVLKYNVPLNLHSGTYSLVYDGKSGAVLFEGKFLGLGRSRWLSIEKVLKYLSNLRVVPLLESAVNHSGMNFKWDISDKNFDKIAGIYNGLCLLTYGNDKKFFQSLIDIVDSRLIFEKFDLLPVRFYDEFFEVLMEQGQYYQEAVQIAKKLSSSDPTTAKQLFMILVRNEQGYPEAIQFAQEMSSTDKRYSFRIFEELVERGQGYPEAIQFAQEISLTDQSTAFRMFMKLIDKGQGYQEAAQAVLQLSSTNYNYFVDAKRLFMALIEKEQGYPEAIKAAQQLISAHPWRGVFLFEALIQKGQGYQEVIKLAEQMISTHPRIAIRLFEALIEKGQGYQDVIKVAEQMISTDPRIANCLSKDQIKKDQSNQEATETALQIISINTAQKLASTNPAEAFSLLFGLIAKGQCYQEAAETALQMIPVDTQLAKSLFLALIEKDQNNQEVIQAAQQMSSTDLPSAISLFRALMKKGQSTQEVIQAAKQLISTSPETAYIIFYDLIEKGQGYQEAAQAALQLSSTHPWKAGRLFMALMKKEHGYPEAIKAAQQLSSTDPGEAAILFENLVKKEVGIPEALIFCAQHPKHAFVVMKTPISYFASFAVFAAGLAVIKNCINTYRSK